MEDEKGDKSYGAARVQGRQKCQEDCSSVHGQKNKAVIASRRFFSGGGEQRGSHCDGWQVQLIRPDTEK